MLLEITKNFQRLILLFSLPMTKMQRNKCMKNQDEDNIFYVDLCHQKNNYVCPKKNEPLEGIKDHCISPDQSCIPEQATDIMNYIKNEAELNPTYLWQCTPNHHEHIFLANVCNDILDCYASGFNDESDLVCERISFIRALSWSFSIVFGIGLLRFIANLDKYFPKAINCKQCLADRRITLTENDFWLRKKLIEQLLSNSNSAKNQST